jgi:RNA polymerase sigma-70 factor (ECF subfamily)
VAVELAERASTPAPPEADAALMARASRGDVAAFAEIYDRHAPALLALARRMLASGAEAEDLVHDVLLEAWQRIHDYDPNKAGVRTWLVIRTRSRALDRIARKARDRDARDSLRPLDPASARHAAVVRDERKLALQQALGGLEATVRQTLELSYFDGLTAAEIAVRMSVPEGTVKSRLARGLRGLHGLLEELGGSHEA